DSRYVLLWDQLRLTDQPQRLSVVELGWIQLFDGERTVRDIQAEAMRQMGGQALPLELFQALLHRLDEALYLDGPRYRERLASPIREPSCLGSYEPEPDRLRRQLERYFTCPAGPGLPNFDRGLKIEDRESRNGNSASAIGHRQSAIGNGSLRGA